VANKQVIVVTDGDKTAYEAISRACKTLGLQPVRATRGNPTPIQGQSLIHAIEQTAGNPVVAMVDDRGDAGVGPGERDLKTILESDSLKVLGVVAVAANTRGVRGVIPEVSIDHDAQLVSEAVNKAGNESGHVLHGDTVDVLRQYPEVLVVGLGDPGKMGGGDAASKGAPATEEALKTILSRRAQA
jgi:stage V sporulation protein AE